MAETTLAEESQSNSKADAKRLRASRENTHLSNPKWVLGSPKRRLLLKILAKAPDNPTNLRDKTGMKSGALWSNLGLLVRAGFVEAQDKENGEKYRYYQATQTGLNALKLVGEMTIHVA